MFCKKCNQPLIELPLYNNGEDDKYAPSVLYCTNDKCTRHGLLTVVYKTYMKGDESSDNLQPKK
jgi:hypothetical protein